MPVDDHVPEIGPSPAVPPSWFDRLTGGEMPPSVAAAAALDDFAVDLSLAPRWMLETGSGGRLALNVRSHRPGEHLDVLVEYAGDRVRVCGDFTKQV